MVGLVKTRRGATTLLAALAAGMVAGCGDTTAPWAAYDPDLTLRHMDAVLAPLDTRGDFLLGLDLAVTTLEHQGSSALASAISLRPERAEGMLRSLRSPGIAVNRTPREGLSRTAQDDGTQALTLPWRVVGETLEWDRYDGYVVKGRSGAPPNGVRFLLYRMDPSTGYPTRPLTLIGYLDLVDADGPATDAVRVWAVRTSGSDRVIADYTVSLTRFGSYSEGGMETTARGVLGEVGTVSLDLLQRFDWSHSRDRDELTLDYTYRRGASMVELDGHAISRYDALDWERFDFESRVWGGRDVTEIAASIGRNGSLRGDILSDGRRVIRIHGYDGDPLFERADGGQLNGFEWDILEQIWTGITDLIWLTDWVMVPADLLALSD